MFQFHRSSSVVIVAVLLAACDDQLTQPPSPPDAEFTILDGARGGDPQFFFLPPMVPAPAYSGTFDATQSPVVEICELAGSRCGATVVSFSGGAVKVDLEKQAYVATWKTKGAGLDPAKTYRIQVLIGTQVLGYADVVVLSNGSQIKTVDKNQFVATINGGVLNIRFRIETAPAPPPPPPPPPGGWQNGDLITYNQDNWGTIGTTASNLLANDFFTVFTNGFVEIGIAGVSGFSAIFSSATAVINYQPTTGVPGPLNADLFDPTSTSSGVFGGHVLALQIDVAFTDAGLVSGSAPLVFGDLRVCGLTDTPTFNGFTVRQVLDALNTAIGGGAAPYSYDQLSTLAQELANSFESGSVSLFAQQHLFNAASCPCTPGTVGCGWKDGDIVTYDQNHWGDPSSIAGMSLVNFFDAVYFTAGGVLEVGSAFTMTFQTASAVLNYQPSAGTPAPLNANLVDPTSSVSGQFGGEVVALKLNIDFSDAEHVSGTANLLFGDLTLCGFTTSLSSLNGTSVRSFLATANVALGGGASTISTAELNTVALNLNGAFESGSVNLFAQDHLFNGACPP